MGITAGLHQQAAAHMPITLLDRQAFSTCRLYQPLARRGGLVESGIGGKTNGLGRDRRVHVDALQLSRTNHPHLHARFNRGAQHLLGPGIAQTLAPARHARRIDSPRRVLKIPHAAEVLLVGDFPPTRQPRLHRSGPADTSDSADSADSAEQPSAALRCRALLDWDDRRKQCAADH